MKPATAEKENIHNGAIRFLLDDTLHVVSDIEPTTTVLNYLRETLHRKDSKEGCAEGDCGACTVVLAEVEGDSIQYRSVNSCIQFLPTLNGKAVFTAESLKKASHGKLHPVQQAMVDCHGSQCGFCTPGFVMSLFNLYKNCSNPDRNEINDALAGNLCRCTGYRPIIDAAKKMFEYAGNLNDDEKNYITSPCGTESDNTGLFSILTKIKPDKTLYLDYGGRYFAPTDLDEFASILADNPDATILAGGTDIGLWVTKQYSDLRTLVYTGEIEQLKTINKTGSFLEIGASVNLTDAYESLLQVYPELKDIYRRFASPPIRNAGTLCGNIANGSPIGDSMPVLIAMGAILVLRQGENKREVALDEFYIAYQKTALKQGEFIEAVRIPLPAQDYYLRTYKISKRFDQDISAVCFAAELKLTGETVENIRICYGGMAEIPRRARTTEQDLLGKQWNQDSIKHAIQNLQADFQPITDMRASSEYRSLVAGNLLLRFYLETCGKDMATQVQDCTA